MSYRSVATRKVSSVDVIGNSPLERVMEVGKLLRAQFMLGLRLKNEGLRSPAVANTTAYLTGSVFTVTKVKLSRK